MAHVLLSDDETRAWIIEDQKDANDPAAGGIATCKVATVSVMAIESHVPYDGRVRDMRDAAYDHVQAKAHEAHRAYNEACKQATKAGKKGTWVKLA